MNNSSELKKESNRFIYFFKKMYKNKNTIFGVIAVCAIGTFSSWYKGESFWPYHLLGAIAGSLIWLFIKSCGIHIGWATAEISEEEKFSLQRIEDLAEYYKIKRQNWWKRLRKE